MTTETFKTYIQAKSKQVTQELEKIPTKVTKMIEYPDTYDKQEIYKQMETVINCIPYVPVKQCFTLQVLYTQLQILATIDINTIQEEEITAKNEKAIENLVEEKLNSREQEQITKKYNYVLKVLEETSMLTIQQIPTIQQYIYDIFAFIPEEDLPKIHKVTRITEELLCKAADLYGDM